MTRTIRTVLPMAADKVGPSRTCARLAGSMADAGAEIEIMVNRIRGERSAAPMLSMMPGPFALLPYRTVVGPASRMLEHRFLRRLQPNDVAWLWPAVSLRTHEEVARRGNPIVLEGINSRMALAKEILDEAYDAFGAPPSHGITKARIEEEDAKIAISDTIFAPNALVEKGLVGTRLEGRFIPTSYGVDATVPSPARMRPRPTGPEDTVVFMFCGYACVRKGIHHLLNVWPRLPPNAQLQIVGGIEPVIAERYADLLASERVAFVGPVDGVDTYYANADVFVFPSHEEGGPQVCYEAAHHGLPMVTSTVGGGRIATDHGIGQIVNPIDLDALEEALMSLHCDPERRRAEGEKAKVIAPLYDWSRVGADRYARLMAFLENDGTRADVPLQSI